MSESIADDVWRLPVIQKSVIRSQKCPMNLFRLVLCLAGVALYIIIRGTGIGPADQRKHASPPAVQSIKDEQSCKPGAPQLTPHQDILPPSNVLAARPPAQAGQPDPAHPGPGWQRHHGRRDASRVRADCPAAGAKKSGLMDCQ